VALGDVEVAALIAAAVRSGIDALLATLLLVASPALAQGLEAVPGTPAARAFPAETDAVTIQQPTRHPVDRDSGI